MSDQHPGRDRGGGAAFDAQLGEDLLQVLVRRAGADVEDFADGAVGLAAGDPGQDVGLPPRLDEATGAASAYQTSLV